MTKCAAEQGTIVRGGSGSNYGDNKTQPLSYHFLSGASHFQPATAVGAVARWWRRMHGCCRGRRRARPGAGSSSPLPAACCVLQLSSALLSSQALSHVTTASTASNSLWFPQQQPAQQSSNWSLGQIFITV